MKDCEIIREDRFEDYDLFVALANRATECRLTIKPKRESITLSVEMLLNILKDLRISVGIDADALRNACQEAVANKPVVDVVVARGILPEEGRDTWLELKVRPCSGHQEHLTNDNGKGTIDFHVTHLFDNVASGQTIAVLHPMEEGKAGFTVRNEVISASVHTRKLSVHAGQGVAFQQNGTDFVATQAGRVLYEQGVLSVAEVFVVDEDVDYSVGHIDFPGFVQVRGDVLDQFNIRAKKGVQIDKNVGNCRIESGGDMIMGGMNGQGIGSDTESKTLFSGATIKCAGNLAARYLHNVTVECEGNIHIAKEVMHCVIQCAGFVVIDGLIVGGKCTALAGIEASRIGTQIGMRTVLCAGVDYRVVTRADELRNAWDDTARRRENLLKLLTPYAHRDITSLPASTTKQLSIMFIELQQLDDRKKSLEKETALLPGNSDNGNPKINVRKELNIGTVIHLGNVIHEVKKTLSGAYSIIEYQGVECRFARMTPLSRHKREIEQALLKEEEAALRKKAEKLGIALGDMKESELILAIQAAEGHDQCFGGSGEVCPDSDCGFRSACVRFKKTSDRQGNGGSKPDKPAC